MRQTVDHQHKVAVEVALARQTHRRTPCPQADPDRVAGRGDAALAERGVQREFKFQRIVGQQVGRRLVAWLQRQRRPMARRQHRGQHQAQAAAVEPQQLCKPVFDDAAFIGRQVAQVEGAATVIGLLQQHSSVAIVERRFIQRLGPGTRRHLASQHLVAEPHLEVQQHGTPGDGEGIHQFDMAG